MDIAISCNARGIFATCPLPRVVLPLAPSSSLTSKPLPACTTGRPIDDVCRNGKTNIYLAKWYILDNKDVVRNRRVLDVGCGCGAGSLAAAMAQARRVVANDIDPYAILVTQINAELNNIKHIELDKTNFIGLDCEEFDVILIGDMFYDPEFARNLFEWLSELSSNNKTVLIGDPGRHGLTQDRRAQMRLLATYNLPQDCRDENNGFTDASVWLLNKTYNS